MRCIITLHHLVATAADQGSHHKSGQRWQDIDGRVDLSVVQLSVHIHLPLSNVACQVRDGVGDVIVRHGEDGQLCDGALAPLNPASALIDGCQVSIHVTCNNPARSSSELLLQAYRIGELCLTDAFM